MQPDLELPGRYAGYMECRRVEGGEFLNRAGVLPVQTLLTGIGQLRAGLCCSTAVCHGKHAIPGCVLPDLDHQARGESALPHYQPGYYQDNDPNKERYRFLEWVLPDQQAMQKKAACRYQKDAACKQWMGQKGQYQSRYVLSFTTTGQQQENGKYGTYHRYRDHSSKTQQLGK